MRIWFGDGEAAPTGWIALGAAWQIQDAIRGGLVSVVSVPSNADGRDLWWWITGGAAQGELVVVPVVEVRA